jgi:hypothetical protein
MVAKSECTHHWMIDSPSGSRFSSGTCKHCGVTRDDFANSVDYSEWYGFNKFRGKGDINKATARQKKWGSLR